MSLASATLAGVFGLMVAVGAVFGIAGSLAVEREDGTLLRAKAIPHGMVGYLVARVLSAALATAVGLVIIILPGLLFVPDLVATGAGWWTLAWVFVLGVLAMLPWGAVAGSVARSPNALFGITMLPITGITAISGIFYPIAALPGWLATVAQC